MRRAPPTRTWPTPSALIAVERGLDPRDFALIAFGGAGPLHARAVAERLGMRTRHRPAASRAVLGLRRRDRRGPGRSRPDASSPTRRASIVAGLAEALERLRDGAVAELRAQRRWRRAGGPQLGRHALCRPELRARGPAADRRARRAGLAETLLAASAEAHAQLYGFDLPGEPVELINLRVTALRPEPPAALHGSTRRRARPAASAARSGSTPRARQLPVRPARPACRRRHPGGPGDRRGGGLDHRRPSGRRARR